MSTPLFYVLSFYPDACGPTVEGVRLPEADAVKLFNRVAHRMRCDLGDDCTRYNHSGASVELLTHGCP